MACNTASLDRPGSLPVSPRCSQRTNSPALGQRAKLQPLESRAHQPAQDCVLKLNAGLVPTQGRQTCPGAKWATGPKLLDVVASSHQLQWPLATSSSPNKLPTAVWASAPPKATLVATGMLKSIISGLKVLAKIHHINRIKDKYKMHILYINIL